MLHWAGIIAVSMVLLFTEKHEHVHGHDAIVHQHGHRHLEGHHDHEHREPLGTVSHSHMHRHKPMTHAHKHWPDLHHRHGLTNSENDEPPKALPDREKLSCFPGRLLALQVRLPLQIYPCPFRPQTI